MNTTAIANWLKQGTTILGISTLVGLLTACLSKQMTWAAATPAALGAISAMLLPQHAPGTNTTIVERAENVLTDAATVQPAAGSTTTIKSAS